MMDTSFLVKSYAPKIADKNAYKYAICWVWGAWISTNLGSLDYECYKTQSLDYEWYNTQRMSPWQPSVLNAREIGDVVMRTPIKEKLGWPGLSCLSESRPVQSVGFVLRLSDYLLKGFRRASVVSSTAKPQGEAFHFSQVFARNEKQLIAMRSNSPCTIGLTAWDHNHSFLIFCSELRNVEN